MTRRMATWRPTPRWWRPSRRGQPPRGSAAALAARLAALPDVAAAEPAGPGFVNLRLQPGALPRAAAGDPARRRRPTATATIGDGIAVNVEYVSANPTGPMHIGHCRGAVVGDALANLLVKAGFDGHQGILHQRCRRAGAPRSPGPPTGATCRRSARPMTEEEFAAAVPGGLQYRGEYLVPVGEALATRDTARPREPGTAASPRPTLWLDTVRDFTIDAMMTRDPRGPRPPRRRAGRVLQRASAGGKRRRGHAIIEQAAGRRPDL